MIPKRSAEDRANLRLRFLELLILISTLLVTLTNDLGSFSKVVFLGFLAFSVLTYVFLIHRIRPDKMPILAVITGFSFSWIFSDVLILQNPLNITESLLATYILFGVYVIVVGLIVTGGLISTGRFVSWIKRFKSWIMKFPTPGIF